MQPSDDLMLVEDLIDVVSQYYVSQTMTLDDARSQFKQILKKREVKVKRNDRLRAELLKPDLTIQSLDELKQTVVNAKEAMKHPGVEDVERLQEMFAKKKAESEESKKKPRLWSEEELRNLIRNELMDKGVWEPAYLRDD